MRPIFRTLLGALLLGRIAHAAEPVKAVREGDQLIFRCGDHEILRYQAEPGELPRPDIKALYRRGGYLQSIHTPAGRLVTDDFPPNHLHHHGVWTPWTKTEFQGRHPDFWNMGDGTGRVEFVALDGVWEKDGRAGFEARHRFVDLTVDPPVTVLLETWKVAVASEEGRYVIDLELSQTCAGEALLKLPEYHYGGFGFRGNRAWDGAENCRFLGSTGLTDRNKVNGSREKWCWVGGQVDGAVSGAAFLCHPANFRAPQPVRAHPTEPFFCFAPPQLGEMEIVPGKPYVAKYRILVADGEPDAAALDKAWEAYAKPVEGK